MYYCDELSCGMPYLEPYDLIYTILSVFFVFHRAFHMISVSNLKIKDFVDLCKGDFLILVSYLFNLTEAAALST